MKYKIAWSGLADLEYWNAIASYCVPSWVNLPGDKFLVSDIETIDLDISLIKWSDVGDGTQGFPVKFSRGTKQTNFWRKMKSQVWAIRNLKKYDFLVLLDTDIEVCDFNIDRFIKIIEDIKYHNIVWSIGSSLEGIDAGFVIVNCNHEKISSLVNDYENYWESGQILSLPNGYDGDVVQEMIKQYEPILVPNQKIDFGQYYYDIGLFHWGSKLSKPIRRGLPSGLEYIRENIKKI